MESAVVVVCTLFAIGCVCRVWGVRGFVEHVLLGYVVGIALVTLWGTVLSGLGVFGSLHGYAVLAGTTAVAAGLVAWMTRRGPETAGGAAHAAGPLGEAGDDPATCRYRSLLLWPLVATAALTAVVNLGVVVWCAPNNWDSLCFHLARVAYYLQQGSMRPFGADFWAQETHPRASPSLLTFLYVVTGRNENLMQLTGFLAYATAVVAVYGITRRCGRGREESLVAAGLAAILTEWLMQANSTQNDIPLTACVGSVVYFLLAYRETGARRYLAAAGFGGGVAFAVKSTLALAVPALAVVAGEALLHRAARGTRTVRDAALLVYTFAMVAGLALFVAGYADNLARFGNLLGPRDVAADHTFAGRPVSYRLRWGTVNAARFGIDFLNIDGAPDFIRPLVRVSEVVRLSAIRVCEGMGLAVTSAEAARCTSDNAEKDVRFLRNRPPRASEDSSFWGIAGIGLIVPIVAATAVAGAGGSHLCCLAVAAVLFFVAQSFAGPYDPWRGRHFSTMAIFAAPLAAAITRFHSPLLRLYALAIVALACLFALAAVTFRPDCRINPPLRGGASRQFWTLSRLEQVAGDLPYAVAFDRTVPRDATVAVCLPGNRPEYVLFGAGLTRTLLPINSFERGVQPIPERADWLLFSSGLGIPVEPGDEALPRGTDGEAWYLRRLR